MEYIRDILLLNSTRDLNVPQFTSIQLISVNQSRMKRKILNSVFGFRVIPYLSHDKEVHNEKEILIGSLRHSPCEQSLFYRFLKRQKKRLCTN